MPPVSPVSAGITLVFGFIMMVFGFASIRRPLESLIQNDPIGKFLMSTRGPTVTRWAYRIFGCVLVAFGVVTAVLALGALR